MRRRLYQPTSRAPYLYRLPCLASGSCGGASAPTMQAITQGQIQITIGIFRNFRHFRYNNSFVLIFVTFTTLEHKRAVGPSFAIGVGGSKGADCPSTATGIRLSKWYGSEASSWQRDHVKATGLCGGSSCRRNTGSKGNWGGRCTCWCCIKTMGMYEGRDKVKNTLQRLPLGQTQGELIHRMRDGGDLQGRCRWRGWEVAQEGGATGNHTQIQWCRRSLHC